MKKTVILGSIITCCVAEPGSTTYSQKFKQPHEILAQWNSQVSETPAE